MVDLTDIKQIAFLQLKGVHFDSFTREGKKKIFHYKESQEYIDKLIAEFYTSNISKYMGIYEEFKTLIFRT